MRALVGLLLLWVSSAAAAASTMVVTVHSTPPQRYELEIAATLKERDVGLMNRATIGAHDGMVFLFPKPTRQAFWMKNTKIPLDMLFVDADKKIVFIKSNAIPNSLTPIAAPHPIISVIELDGGRAARDGIAPGDRVIYDIPAGVDIQ